MTTILPANPVRPEDEEVESDIDETLLRQMENENYD
jgi:hypothetical protein